MAVSRETRAFPLELVLSLGVLVAVICGAGVAYHAHQSAALRKQAQEDLSAIADLKAGQIAGWLRERKADAAVISSNVMLSEAAVRWLRGPGPKEAQDTLGAWMDAMLTAYNYEAVVLLGPDGTVLHARPHGARLCEQHRALAFEAARTGQPRVSDLVRDHEQGRPHLGLAAPLPPPVAGGRSPGVMVIQIDPERFLYPLIQSWPTPSPTAESLLVRPDGDSVLYLNELRHRSGTALTLRLPLTEDSLPAAMAVRGAEGVLEGIDYRGVPVLAALRAVPGTDWKLIAKVDSSEILAPIGRQAQFTLVVVILTVLTVAALIAAAWASRERAYSEQRQQQHLQEELLRRELGLLSKHANDIILLFDEQWRVVEANERALDSYGYSPGEFAGLSLEALQARETTDHLDSFMSAMNGGGDIIVETVHRKRDGSTFAVELSARQIGLDGRRLTQAIIRDITDRKRYEREREATIQLLGLLNSANDTSELLDLVAGLIVDWTGCDAAAIRLREGDTYPYRAVAGLPEGIVAEENDLGGPDGARPGGLCGLAIRGFPPPDAPNMTERGTVWTNNLSAYMASQEAAGNLGHLRGRCYEHGYRSVALVPVRFGEEALGLLQVCDQRAGFFDEAMLALLEQLASNLAIGLAQRQARDGLRRSEQIHRAITENLSLGIVLIDPQMRLIAANPTVTAWFPAVRPQERPPCARVLGGSDTDEPCPGCPAATAFADGQVHEAVFFRDTADGAARRLRVIACPVRGEAGQVSAVIEAIEDVTYQAQLEDQLRQAAKTEAIGQLAGGIAHDFNNLLSVILTQAELWQQEYGYSRDIALISQTALQAADLTRQLLAFGRRQALQPEVVCVNDIVETIASMLRRVIGEHIELEIVLAPDLCNCFVDRVQVEQVILNLAANARDAMPGGGKLTIETARMTLDAAYAAQHAEVSPGEYAMLAVSDTGSGMDAATIARAFEPYFTTKEPGRGTGLGLSVVQGAVRQSGGHVYIYSEMGRGTTVKVYFPRASAEQEAIERQPVPEPKLTTGAGEIVLVVEDQEQLRTLACRVLEMSGYRVLEAVNPQHAREWARTEPRIDLLFTDVVMPGASGYELALELQELHPEARVLYTSGYTENIIAHHGVLNPGVALLQKPYTPTSLTAKVREALGG